jgi:hypothetical protein
MFVAVKKRSAKILSNFNGLQTRSTYRRIDNRYSNIDAFWHPKCVYDGIINKEGKERKGKEEERGEEKGERGGREGEGKGEEGSLKAIETVQQCRNSPQQQRLYVRTCE